MSTPTLSTSCVKRKIQETIGWNIHEETIRRWCKDRGFGFRVGRQFRIPAENLDRLLRGDGFPGESHE